MKITFIKRMLAAGVLIPALLFCSCIKEQLNNPSDGDEALVTFSLNVPGAATPSTRAMTGDDENAIDDISVLAFKAGTFSYKASGNQIEANGAQNKKKFTVTLRKGEYDLVIVANASSILSGVNLSGKSKADAMAMLETGMPSGNKWAVTGSVKSIPMWGNVGSKDVGTDAIPEISLLRMLARVNVTLTESGSKFSMTSVHLYNYNDKGMLSPAPADWNASTVAAPNLPSSPGRTEGPVDFGVTGTDASINDIYMFEAAAGSKTTLSVNPCIVVGGTYDGQPAFYRIDMATNPDTYLAIKRNHSYNISITAVKNAGHPTADDAFRAGPENISVKILEWNDGGMGEVVFDGQNMLSVSKGEFEVGRDAASYSTNILTDVPTGWKATAMDSWITFPGAITGVKGVKTALAFNVTQNNDGTDRTGTIKITAGRLEYSITVIQNMKQALALSVSQTDITFAAGGETKDIDITWIPTTNPCDIAFVPDANGGINFVPSIPSNTTAGGTYHLTLTATVLDISSNPFAVKSGTLVVKAHNDDGDEISQTVNLKQLKYNTVAKAEDYYMLNGGTYSFSVRSNTEWKITAVSDPDGILDNSFAPALLNQTGGYNTTTGGQIVNFKFITDATGVKNGKTVTLTLTDPTGRMTPVTVILKGVTCGTGGVAIKQRIGTNEYLTHQYGDKCWMVENLKEGINGTGAGKASAIYFGQGGIISGYNPGTGNGQYYYTYQQAATICPTGWHLPTDLERQALSAEVNTADRNTNPVSKWWCGTQAPTTAGAFAGFYQISNITWNYWNYYGTWWYGPTGQVLFGNTTLLTASNFSAGYWCSVRCVQNQ